MSPRVLLFAVAGTWSQLEALGAALCPDSRPLIYAVDPRNYERPITKGLDKEATARERQTGAAIAAALRRCAGARALAGLPLGRRCVSEGATRHDDNSTAANSVLARPAPFRTLPKRTPASVQRCCRFYCRCCCCRCRCHCRRCCRCYRCSRLEPFFLRREKRDVLTGKGDDDKAAGGEGGKAHEGGAQDAAAAGETVIMHTVRLAMCP